MKNATRVLSLVLSVLMVLSCLAGMSFVVTAEDEIKSAEYAPYSTADGYTKVSCDTLYINGATIKDGSAADHIASAMSGVIDDSAKDIASFGLRGWEGNLPFESFGYAIGDRAPVFGDFVQATEDAVKGAGGANASRYNITFDLAGVPDGKYKVYPLIKTTDGTVYWLDRWGDITLVVGNVAAPAEKPETDYVTDGLVSLFTAADHTDSVWTDVWSGNDLTVTVNANNGFTADGYHLNNSINNFPQALVDVVNGQEFTVEMLFGEFISTGANFNTFLNSANDNFALFRRVSNNVLEWKFAANGGADRCTVGDGLNLLQNALISVTYKVGGNARIYVNGELVSEKPAPKEMGANSLYIGHTDAKGFDTTYKSIRFYDRELTADEIAANAEVDGKTAEEVTKVVPLGTAQGAPFGRFMVDQSCAVKYTLPKGAKLVSFDLHSLATYNDSTDNAVKLEVFAWNGDYAATVAGTPLAVYAEEPHVDNAAISVKAPEGEKIGGELLLVITYTKGEAGMTPWIAGTLDPDAVFFNNGEEVLNGFCCNVTYSITSTEEPDERETSMDVMGGYNFGVYSDDPASTFGFANAHDMHVSEVMNSGYLTFTAEGGDPYVWLFGKDFEGIKELSTKLVDYAVVKYRTTKNCGGEFFVQRADGINPGQPGSHVAFSYVGDGQWHTAVVDMSEVWGNVDTTLTIFRFDPMFGDLAAGDEVDVAYIKFFSNAEAANAFAAAENVTKPVKGELVEGDPAIFQYNGAYYTADEYMILVENKVEIEAPMTSIEADVVTAMSPDTLIVNGERVKDGAAHEYIAQELGGKIENADYSKETIGFRGWAIPNGGVGIAAFGYSLNDGEIVWDGEIVLDEVIIPILQNELVRRYVITIPATADALADGAYNVYLYVKGDDGSVQQMAVWGDIQILQGSGKNYKVEGYTDAEGNTVTINGIRVLNEKGVDTGMTALKLDDGRIVAVSHLIPLNYQDPLAGAVTVGDKKYTYEQKIAVTDVIVPVDPADNSVVSENAGMDGCAMSPDTLFLDGTIVKDGAAHSYIASNLGGMIRDTACTMGSFSLRGWAHTSSEDTIVAYGYALNDGEIVWNEGWVVAPEPGLAAAAGGANTTRYKIDIAVGDLAEGMYNVYAFLKTESGDVRRLVAWGDFKFVKGGSFEQTGYTDGQNTYGMDSVIYTEGEQKFVLLGTTDVTNGMVAGYDYNTVVDSCELDLGTNVGTVNNNSADTFNNEGSIWAAAGYTVPGTQLYNLWGHNGTIIFNSLPFADYNTVEIIVGSDPSCDAFQVGFITDVAHTFGKDGGFDMTANLVSDLCPAGSEGQPNLSGRGEGNGWNRVERLVRLDIADIDFAGPVAISVGSVAPHTMIIAKVTFINYAVETVKGKYVYDTTIDYVAAPEAPFNPNELNLVYILDGEGLNTQSPARLEDAVYDYAAGCIRYVSTAGDPNAGSTQIPAGTQVARYMVVKYRTECAGARGEVFTGTGTGATGGSNVPFPSEYIADGQWHYLVADLARSGDYDVETGVINHFRNDCLQGGDQWVEIEYYAFFNTMAEAEYYGSHDLHELPQPLKTFTATFVADGEVIKVVEFTEGDTSLVGVPKVPAKEGYTAKWESYTLGSADIVVNAIYTEKETEPVETEPAETDPIETTPAETDPATTEPAATEPVTEPAATETAAESETEAVKTGCKSVVAASAVLALVAVFGTALVIKKKED